MAVEVGDRISFAVGSAPERLQWAIDTAEAHLKKINRPRNSIQLGAYINLVCDRDEKTALSLGKLAQRQGGFLISITHQVDVGTQLDGVAGAIDLF